jgi:hypothetical protein
MLISTALLLDSNIRNSVCTPAKLPCRRVEVGYEKIYSYITQVVSYISIKYRNEMKNEKKIFLTSPIGG